MKIMDEKGRLFGKINVIDFLVILFLLSLTPMFYFGYKIYGKQTTALKAQEQAQPEKLKEELITITINCKFIKLKPEVAQMVSAGDKELDSDGNLIGEVVSLGESAPYSYEFDVGPNQKLIKRDSELQQMAVTLKINSVIRGKNIYYKDKQILEGGTLEFSPEKYSAEVEDIAIIKDNYNTVIDSTVENASIKEEKLDTHTLKKELEPQLTNLERILESSLEQLTNKISELEKKMGLFKSIIEEIREDKKSKKGNKGWIYQR